MPIEIAAFDLSLSATGWATSRGCGTLTPPKGQDRGIERLSWIRAEVLSLALTAAAELVVLEGYAYARGNKAHQIGELGGVVRLTLFDVGLPFVDVPPASLKKYATGKGNAGKELVLVEAVKRLEYEGADHNEADALWLRQAALARYGLPGVVEVPKSHRAAIDRVTWPDIPHLQAA